MFKDILQKVLFLLEIWKSISAVICNCEEMNIWNEYFPQDTSTQVYLQETNKVVVVGVFLG